MWTAFIYKYTYYVVSEHNTCKQQAPENSFCVAILINYIK